MIAFAQAGISPQMLVAASNRNSDGDGDSPAAIEALASLYYEPAWLFLRDDVQITDFRDLAALRIAKGPLGSGSRALAETLYALNDLPFETGAEQKAPDQLSGDDALAALVLGQIDGVFTVGSAHSPSIKLWWPSPDYRFSACRAAMLMPEDCPISMRWNYPRARWIWPAISPNRIPP
ncbi:hypothetical protein JCM17846_18080 [Iodidimonas nitroreducens]|uniref:Uncharacterized protein n=2 Tax=Iodidimonas nitroreducens TaxID=1236968 RepID=A0A5A7NAZ2_9PROT|nr:hypothetical protein JCM17846_18080 [Iodidimonas nitroreducens]